jgi:hypothetical protein
MLATACDPLVDAGDSVDFAAARAALRVLREAL